MKRNGDNIISKCLLGFLIILIGFVLIEQRRADKIREIEIRENVQLHPEFTNEMYEPVDFFESEMKRHGTWEQLNMDKK